MKRTNLKQLACALAIVGGIAFSVNAYAQNGSREAYQEKVEAKIEKLEEKIEKLRAEAKEAKDPALLEQWAEGLNNLKDGTKTQFEKLQSSSADGWENLKEGVNTAMDNTEAFYRDVKRDYYHWRTETRLNSFIEKKKELEKKAASIDGNKVGLVEKNFSTFSNRVKEAQEKLADLKEADADVRSQLQSDIEYSLDQIEITYHHLGRQVKLLASNQTLDKYTQKLNDLKAKASSVSKKSKNEFNQAIDSLEGKVDEAKDKVEDLAIAGKENWEKIGESLDSALNEVEKKYNQALNYVTQG